MPHITAGPVRHHKHHGHVCRLVPIAPGLGLDSKTFLRYPAPRERNEERHSSYHLELVAVPKCATLRIFPLWSRARTNHEAHPSVE